MWRHMSSRASTRRWLWRSSKLEYSVIEKRIFYNQTKYSFCIKEKIVNEYTLEYFDLELKMGWVVGLD